MRSRLTYIALFAGGLFLIAALAFNQSAVHWRGDVDDSDLFAYYGWCVAHGAVPYLDVWDNKPPGVWWLNALGYRLFGDDARGELLICSVALLGTILGFIAIARTAYHPSIWPVALPLGGVLLTHVFFQCGANRTETFVATCETLAVLGYLRWRRDGRWRWLLWGGFFAGAAPLFKQAGLAAAGACILHLAWSQFRARRLHAPPPGRSLWKPWLIGGGAFAIPLLIAALALGVQGALPAAYFAIVRFNQAYFAIGDATWFNLRHAVQPYLEVISPLYGLGLLAGAAAVLSLVRRPATETAPSSNAAVLWLWLLFSAYLACVGPGRQPYHLGPVLAPLGLVALQLPSWWMAGQSLSRRIVAKPSLAALLAVYLYVSCALGHGSAVQAAACWTTKAAWWAPRREPPAGYEVRAAEIRRLTKPDEKIYVWGWSPGAYRYAYRRSVSRYATLEKTGHVGRLAEFIYKGVVADLHRDPPVVFVVSEGDLNGLLSCPQGDMAGWIRENYVDRGDCEGMHILLRTPFLDCEKSN
jgi:hypothetical protein